MRAKVIETPAKYQGLWIAWNDDHTEVIASGKVMAEVEKEARKITENYWLDKVPSNREYFGGSATLQ